MIGAMPFAVFHSTDSSASSASVCAYNLASFVASIFWLLSADLVIVLALVVGCCFPASHPLYSPRLEPQTRSNSFVALVKEKSTQTIAWSAAVATDRRRGQATACHGKIQANHSMVCIRDTITGHILPQRA